MLIYFQDQLIPEEQACVPAGSGLVLFGMGVFASLICYGGKPFYFSAHYQKLSTSALLLGLAMPEEATLRKQVQATLEANGLEKSDCRLRITVGQGTPQGADLLLISAGDLPAHAPTAVAGIAPWRRNPAHPLATVKSTAYAENILARGYAQQHGLTEAIWLNTDDHVCEGTTSNLFWVTADGQTLCTPAVDSGCLAGVTRSIVIELASEMGISCQQGHFPAEMLDQCSEAFFTSTYRGIQPISNLSGRSIASPQTGITSGLQAAFTERVKNARAGLFSPEAQFCL